MLAGETRRGHSMIKVRRISHATFETPDLARQADYYTGVAGLVPLAENSDRMISVSRLGAPTGVVQRGATPSLTKLAFQVAPDDELPLLAKALGGEGIKA